MKNEHKAALLGLINSLAFCSVSVISNVDPSNTLCISLPTSDKNIGFIGYWIYKIEVGINNLLINY